jgi:thymidylate synthase ThyX
MDRPVFALRGLPEEVVAVLFAYYSRSTGSLRQNLERLLADGDVAIGAAPAESEDALSDAMEKARKFHEKWVVGYGHSSVAEHAVVHLALEDVSILASKVIEDARLASYTEKSTRYVVFNEDRYYTPSSLAEGPSAAIYREACRHLLGAYARLMPEAVEKVKARRPRGPKQTERGWETACKAAACDILRYLLPASTRTNIGLTVNARALEYLLTKMMSNPLEECRDLGVSMKAEAQRVAPTLIKYAEPNPYMVETRAALQAFTPWKAAHEAPLENAVRLVKAPQDPEADLAAALLYEYSDESWETLRCNCANWPSERREEVIRAALLAEENGGRRRRFDQPPRALEHLYYTFEITLDFGAFRDIQRHRMATQSRQRLTTAWGYATPPEIAEFGWLDIYEECMARAAEAYAAIAREQPEEAQYVVPLAYRMRVLFTWNLREIHHFVSLRSGKQGHAAYRKIAQDVWTELHRLHPLMAEYVRVDMNHYGLARE